MERLLLAALFFMISSSVTVAEIPRDGFIKAPTTEEAAAICESNLEGDTEDRRLVYCVVSELEGASNVIELISNHPEVASEAYWDCADNPKIGTFTQLNRCMTTELERVLDLREEPATETSQIPLDIPLDQAEDLSE